MSFLIKISDDQYEDDLIHKYEIELIYSVANMNKIFIETFELPSFCLGCLGIRYIDYKSKTGFTEIDHISEMLDKGYGKCDSIVAWFITLFKLNDVKAEPIIIPLSKDNFHIKLKYQDGATWKILDPAIDLDKIIFENCLECRQKMLNGTFRKKRKLTKNAL